MLSALPCSDELEVQAFEQKTIAKVEHNKASGSTESCSPICLCTCCGQSVVEPQLVTFQLKSTTFVAQNRMASYQFSVEQITQNIWQPPKLV